MAAAPPAYKPQTCSIDGTEETLTQSLLVAVCALREKNPQTLKKGADGLVLDDGGDVRLSEVPDVGALAAGLGSSVEGGLESGASSTAALASRKAFYGSNAAETKEMSGFFALCWRCFTGDPILEILAVAAVVSFIIGIWSEGWAHGWYEGASILAAMLIVILVTGFQDWQGEKQFAELQAQNADFGVTTVRGGAKTEVNMTDIVVGDVILLASGDMIPADCIFIEGDSMKADESSLTGESDMLKKSSEAGQCFLIGGSAVAEGTGKALVVAVGANTMGGKINELLAKDDDGDDMTPLQAKLKIIADDIAIFGFVSASLTVAVLIIKFMVQIHLGDTDWIFPDSLEDLLEFVIIGITVVIVAIPEGLPLAVTLSLSFSSRRMTADNCMVRQMASCETMGGATSICTDKTGTLTTNRMTVMQTYFAGKQRTPKDVKGDVSEAYWTALSNNMAVNRGQSFLKEPAEAGAPVEYLGNKTECAILLMLRDSGIDYEAAESAQEKVAVNPFSSKLKRMSTVVKLDNGKYRVFMKGASEIMLQLSTEVPLYSPPMHLAVLGRSQTLLGARCVFACVPGR